MNENVIKIKKMLKLETFHPYKLKPESNYRDYYTGVQINPTDYPEDRFIKLMESCGRPHIGCCYFKCGNLIFNLNRFEYSHGKNGNYFLKFILQGGIDGNLHVNRPSRQDINDFVNFIGGNNE